MSPGRGISPGRSTSEGRARGFRKLRETPWKRAGRGGREQSVGQLGGTGIVLRSSKVPKAAKNESHPMQPCKLSIHINIRQQSQLSNKILLTLRGFKNNNPQDLLYNTATLIICTSLQIKALGSPVFLIHSRSVVIL